MLDPSAALAGGYYDELLPGECGNYGSNTHEMLRICNRSTPTNPDLETRLLLGPTGKAAGRVIPEDYGIKTEFIYTLAPIEVSIGKINIPLGYKIRRVLSVTDQ